jgi:excisionase family DNA binding protein
MSEPLLLGVRAACREVGGIGRDSMYELVRTGRIRCVRVGKKILIPRSELEDFVRREMEEAPT